MDDVHLDDIYTQLHKSVNFTTHDEFMRTLVHFLYRRPDYEVTSKDLKRLAEFFEIEISSAPTKHDRKLIMKHVNAHAKRELKHSSSSPKKVRRRANDTAVDSVASSSSTVIDIVNDTIDSDTVSSTSSAALLASAAAPSSDSSNVDATGDTVDSSTVDSSSNRSLLLLTRSGNDDDVDEFDHDRQSDDDISEKSVTFDTSDYESNDSDSELARRSLRIKTKKSNFKSLSTSKRASRPERIVSDAESDDESTVIDQLLNRISQLEADQSRRSTSSSSSSSSSSSKPSALDALKSKLPASFLKPAIKSKPSPSSSLLASSSSSSSSSSPAASSSLVHSLFDGVDMNNYASDEHVDNFEEREARGLLIDNTRISSYILQQQPSLYKYVTDVAKFKNNRNYQECLQLSKMIDELVSEGAVDINTSVGLERAIRRLIGVITADNLGKWETCTALQLQDHSTTLLPPLLLDRIIKRSGQISRFTQPQRNNYFNDRNDDDNNQHNNNYTRRFNNNNFRGGRGAYRGGRGAYTNNNHAAAAGKTNPSNANNNNNNARSNGGVGPQ